MKIKLLLITLVILNVSFSATALAEERMISAGGSITEIIYEFGMADQIIAVDSSSYFPVQATQKPTVGYFRRLSAEGILSLNPTRLVGSNGMGPDDALTQIKNAGVEVKAFNQEIYTFDAWKAYIKDVGKYFGLLHKAEQLIARVEVNLQKVTENAKNKSDTATTAVFLMDLGDRGPVAAGKNTVPDMLFDLAGFDNVVKDFEGFKPFSTERLIQIKPDVIVMPNHVVEKLGGVDNICLNMMIKMVTVERGCDILVIDALLALGFGTRIDQAVEALLEYQPNAQHAH